VDKYPFKVSKDIIISLDIGMEIKETDIKVEFFRGSGPGGQHRNVTDSAVRIRHMPTGIVVQASEQRSQANNRRIAMERLLHELKKRELRRKKRIRTAVPKKAKEDRLAVKRLHAKKIRERKLTDSD
jgi:peptide chain release factor